MYKKILVPIDGSATSRQGLNEAVALAKVHGAELLLLHVVDEYALLVGSSASALAFGELRGTMLKDGAALLEDSCASARAAGVEARTALREVTSSRVSHAIVEECREAACDLIVMGTHGRRGFSRLMLGSDADAVLRSSPVPVLLVRAKEAGS